MKTKIYEVYFNKVIDLSYERITEEEILIRFFNIKEAKDFKRYFEDLWQVHYDDKTTIYPSWIDCDKELTIKESYVYGSIEESCKQ